MRLKRTAAILAATAAFSFPAHAADHSGQAYVAGSLGLAIYSAGDLKAHYESQAAYYRSFSGVSAQAEDDDSGLSFTLGGGYQINPFVAVEAFYRRYGELKDGMHATDGTDHVDESTTLSAAGPGIGIVGLYPATEALSLYLRLDALNLKMEDEYRYQDTLGNPAQQAVADDTNVTLGFGLGAQYDLNEGYVIRADYQRIRAKLEYANGTTNEGDINTVSLGLLKMF